MENLEKLKSLTKVKLKNLDKCFYPKINITKGQIVEYYIKMAPKILPIIANRPLVLTRYPDGVDGRKMAFFEKNAPQGTPEWVKTEPIYSSSTKRNINYIICNDLDTLIWLANLAALEIHMPFSTISNLSHPDLLFFDVDPETPATIGDAAEVALLLKDKLCRMGLTPFVKTSGKKGLHVVISLTPRWGFEETRAFVHQVGIELAKEHSIVASEFKDTKTPGRVFIDYLQNSPMRTMVIPYSLRPTSDATVSTPLEWHEVKRELDPSNFNISSVVAHRADPWRDLLKHPETLHL
ncbi:MAG: non-homologous end-joining DNA ligase [Nitrososphaerota archaeon]|jgi:bifunctional non-homologous end joining protein LigD|nr:non-homologous end-joining DNA ligase [Nitrososphaerota archaeon]